MSRVDLPIWLVYLLEPRNDRQRKHNVLVYRVGAETEQEARDAVRQEMDERLRQNLRIVLSHRHGTAGRVMLDHVTAWTPERITELDTAYKVCDDPGVERQEAT